MTYQTDAGDGGPRHRAEKSTSISPPNSLTWLTHVAGAAVSAALVAGVGYWGYKLTVRDVSGIPIVRALEGDMRVRPDEPGGNLARHQGLAVNEVAAAGSASAPPDRLVLAPQPVRLTEEDMPMDEDAVAIVQQVIAEQAQAGPEVDSAPEPQSDDTAARIAAAAQSGSVEDLVAVLTEGTAPLDPSDAPDPATVVEAALAVVAIDPALQAAPGVRQSMRPKLRPAVMQRAAATVIQASLGAAVDPNNLPAGTRLVQLGAYDSVEVAQVEWAKYAARFQDLMAGKAQIVQQASSGGRSFYRLRAMGFDDLSEARRFCSALVAEGADCIPVVTR